MVFSEKIDNILQTNTLGISSISAMEDYCDISRSTITRIYNGETVNGLKTEKKIIDKLRINKIWWDTGEGPIYLMDETPPQSVNDGQVPESIYRDLVEANSEYRLVPKTILQEEYRIMLLSDIEYKKQLNDKVTAAKDDYIALLEKQIASLEKQVAELRDWINKLDNSSSTEAQSV